MPFESQVAPFVGDDDPADFMLDVWLPFARDDCGWVDNQAPAVGTRPDVEIWTHRGTAVAREAPYFFVRTTDRNLFLFTGTGVNTGEEVYDQPGNPCNAPAQSDFTIPAGTHGGDAGGMRCGFVGSLVGPYEAYWLFSDTSGRYVHCVIKVAARQYRHFHIGLFDALHSDLDAEAFYRTQHHWEFLAPDGYSLDPPTLDNDSEHNPYSGLHRTPFQFGVDSQSGFTAKTQAASVFYLPGINAGHDWYHPIPNSNLTAELSKSIGGVNAALTVGIANCSGYGPGLGTILYQCDRSFTSGMVPLIPIYVSAAVPFEGLNRQGVVAQVPDVFRVNMRSIDAEQEIVVGSDTYVCFPLINKDSQNTLDGEGYSAWEGLAYRKETGAVT